MMQSRFLLLVGVCAALMLGAMDAMAEPYPSKAIRLVVPYPPGGQSDLTARLVAQKLGELLDGSLIVENRPGANGTIGAELVASAAADGYTLLLGSGGNITLAPSVYSTVRYEAPRDFTPVGRVANVPLVLVARSGLPVEDVPQLLEYANKNPAKLTYASASALTQVAFESLKNSAGIDIVHVPYKGTAPAVLDVVAGRVDVMVADVAAVTPHVRAGSLRVLANAGAVRSDRFRNVPTMAEQGLPEFVLASWQGLLGPRDLPADVLARLQTSLQKLQVSEQFREALGRLGFESVPDDAASFSVFLREETERFRRIVARAGLRDIR